MHTLGMTSFRAMETKLYRTILLVEVPHNVQYVVLYMYMEGQCVVPESIHMLHPPSMEGHWKFLGGGGS